MDKEEHSPLASLSEKTRLSHLLHPLKVRDFLLLWAGQTSSSLGNSLQSVALSWMVLALPGSAALHLTLTLLSLAIPQALATPIGGIMADRLDARSIMLYSDGMRLLTSSTIALLAMTSTPQLWLLCSLLALHGASNGFFAPAVGSITPRLVKQEDLGSANALSSSIGQLGSLIGTLPAGLLVVTSGPAPAFALNALSYLIALATTLLMRPLEREHRLSDKPASLWQDARESLRYLRTCRWLVIMLLMDLLVAVAAIATNPIGFALLTRNVFHAGAGGFSLLLWSYSGGAVAGMIVSSLSLFRQRRGLICILFQGIEAVLMAMIAIVPLPVASLCVATWSLLNGILVVLSISLIQQHVARNMLGRMMSFWVLASVGCMPLAQLGGGLIASTAGPQPLFLFAGSIMMFGVILGILTPELRQLS